MASYKRMNALIYAAAFWDKVCHDSRVATDSGYPRIPAGTPMDKAWQHPNWKGSEDDCTHFISCCIGQTKGKITVGSNTFTINGGGLKIPCPFSSSGVYGHTHVSNIYYVVQFAGAKIVGAEFRSTGDPQTRSDIVSNLGPGDLLIYSADKHIKYHKHCVMILQSTFITCHTQHRFGKDFTDVKIPFVTLMKMP